MSTTCREETESSEIRPAGVTVLAILNLVFGAMLFVSPLVSGYLNLRVPSLLNIFLAPVLSSHFRISFVPAALLIVSGFSLLRGHRRLGYICGNLYAALNLGSGLVLFPSAFVSGGPSSWTASLVASQGAVVLVANLYPILLLVLLNGRYRDFFCGSGWKVPLRLMLGIMSLLGLAGWGFLVAFALGMSSFGGGSHREWLIMLTPFVYLLLSFAGSLPFLRGHGRIIVGVIAHLLVLPFLWRMVIDGAYPFWILLLVFAGLWILLCRADCAEAPLPISSADDHLKI